MDVVWPHGAPRRLENLNLSASEKAKLMQAMAAEGVGSSARCVKLNKILQRNLMKIQLIQDHQYSIMISNDSIPKFE